MQLTRVVDPFGLGAAVIAAASVGLYLGVMTGQDSTPATWVVASLVGATAVVLYGSVLVAPIRIVALVLATGVLGVLGIAALLSIGLVIMGAAALSLVATLRAVLPARSAQPAERYSPSR